MRIYTIIVLSILVGGIAFSQTNLSGTIATDSVLSLAGNPYIVTGDVTVNAPHTLTVDSGVVVRFKSNTSLYILGHLNARWATFTSNKDTSAGFPLRGDWGGIQIGNYSSSGTASLDTCQIKYSGSIQAELYINSGNVSVNGSSFSNSSKDCISIGGGNLLLANSNLSNATGNGLSLNGNSTTNFTSSSVSFCSWPIWSSGSSAVLTFNGNNSFTSNTNNGIDMNFNYSGTMVLDTASIPYVFLGDFYVNSGATVTVCAGNVLKFGNGVHLYVNGVLAAVGSTSHNINFTSYRNDNLDGDTNGDGTTTAPAVNDWGGVVFNDPSVDALCVMKNCSISFAGSGGIGGLAIHYAASPPLAPWHL